ncbi:MAG TPA: DUF3108 domain-containing protein [Ramlibacter sp.]|nr:DUF3108 domain-containing protein [Ramlibacter sp.]
MVRSPRLKLLGLAALVAIAHLVALEWFARQADAISAMPAMAPVVFTRMLEPAAPAPVVPAAAAPAPQPKPRAAARPKPPDSAADERRREQERAEQEAELARQRSEEEERERQAQQERAAAQAAEEERLAREQQAADAAAAAASAAAAAAALDRWPTDTRLTYQITGYFRGPLVGDARVLWQREGTRYQVRLDVSIPLFGTQVLTSQGEVAPDGLLPRAYEELRPGKRRFAQLGDEVVVLENGRTLPRPPGVQDTASQFMELSQRFATGKDVLEVGRTVSVWLARPGGLDQWTYDIVEREMLRTPQLGELEAFHLKPRGIPNPRGNISAEMWIAPSLQYLPVRIKVVMGDEAWLDLLVDHIEQR